MCYLSSRLCFNRRDRKLYYHHREKAKKYPRVYMCIAQDGVDQAKLLLPRLIVTAHAYASVRKLRTHLTGVLNHGRQPKGYFDLLQFPHDANLTINILLLEIQSMGEDLPDTLLLQMDNCWRENKNQFVLNFLAVLVMLDIFVKVNLITHIYFQWYFISSLHNGITTCRLPPEIKVIARILYTPIIFW